MTGHDEDGNDDEYDDASEDFCAECGEPLHVGDMDGLCEACAFDGANEDDPGQDGVI